MKASVLPENILKCMTPQDRKAIGQKSASEALAHGERVSERKLQGQIVNLLRLRNIEVLWHRTDRRSAATVGWPDLTFCVKSKELEEIGVEEFLEIEKTIPVTWEVKTSVGKLTPEQVAMGAKLTENGWRWRCVRSVDEARKELSEMGLG